MDVKVLKLEQHKRQQEDKPSFGISQVCLTTKKKHGRKQNKPPEHDPKKWEAVA